MQFMKTDRGDVEVFRTRRTDDFPVSARSFVVATRPASPLDIRGAIRWIVSLRDVVGGAYVALSYRGRPTFEGWSSSDTSL